MVFSFDHPKACIKETSRKIMVVLFTILSAFLYRIGGLSKDSAKKYFPWFPQILVRSCTRDLGCSLLVISWALMFLPIVAWWRYLIAFILTYGALTTYWDDSPINWMKGEDNYYLHGFFIGLAFFPISFTWLMFARAVVLGLFMGLWCGIFKDDFTEEFGRGGSIIATLPII